MPDPISQTLAAPETQTTTVTVDAQPKAKDDIVERVSKSLAESKQGEAIQFNLKDIEKITDPAARKYAEDAYKSFQADYTRKTQEIAATKRELEALKQQTEQPWTPERIKTLLNDPTFVNSAKQVAGDSPDESETWSSLTPEEKKAQDQRDQQIRFLYNELTSFKTQAEDEKLRARYADYDPETVNKLQMDLITGKYRATREDIYKVANFERAVKQAYELGQKDRQLNLLEKRDGLTQIGPASITPTDQIPEKQPKENTVEYIKRLYLRRMQAQGQK